MLLTCARKIKRFVSYTVFALIITFRTQWNNIFQESQRGYYNTENKPLKIMNLRFDNNSNFVAVINISDKANCKRNRLSRIGNSVTLAVTFIKLHCLRCILYEYIHQYGLFLTSKGHRISPVNHIWIYTVQIKKTISR